MEWFIEFLDRLFGEPGGNQSGGKRDKTGRKRRVDPDRFIKPYEEAKERGDEHEMERLLLKFVEATEADAARTGQGVAPWPYGKLASLYYTQGDYEKEVEVLERYAEQPHAPGKKPEKLMNRLSKARGRANGGDER